MEKEKVDRTIKLFRHLMEEAEKDRKITMLKPRDYWRHLFYEGMSIAYEFCADYIEANFK